MNEPPVIHAPIRERAEILAQLDQIEDQAKALRRDIANVENAMRLYRPDFDFSGLKAKHLPAPYQARRGENVRPILEALRQAERPMTARELVAPVTDRRGPDASDRELADRILGRVRAALRAQRGRGGVRSQRTADGRLVWFARRYLSCHFH